MPAAVMQLAVAIAGCTSDPVQTSAPKPIAVLAPAPPPTPHDACNVRATVEQFAARTTRFWLDDEHAARAQAGFVDGMIASFAVTDAVADDAKQLTARVTRALKLRDYSTLAKLVGHNGLCLRARKGGTCHWMSAKELAHCGHGRREEWDVDSGADTLPRLDCADAFASIFYNRDFEKATPKLNCFPELGRGNNTADILTDEVNTVIYVELYDEDDRGNWGALWLHLAYDDVDLELVGLTSEYWGI
ncbi:MAG TPA: hypothetical protein VGG28_23420 [Kofleriaceae bacterium]